MNSSKKTNEYFLEVCVGYPKELHKNHSKLLFLAKRMIMGREEN